jgi:hypothetical protein
MRRFTASTALFVFIAAVIGLAQNVPASANAAGWYGAFNLGVSHDGDGWNNELGSTLGYDIDRHWAVETGVPMYFVAPSSSLTSSTSATTTTASSSDSYAALGDAFARLKYDPHWKAARYNTSLTATAPTGSRTHGISSGHATWNWGNKLETDMWRVSPYVQASLANSLANSMNFQRAFTTYGFISEQKAGLSFDVFKGVSIEGSYYNVAPLADQTVYSHVRGKGQGSGNAVLASNGQGKGNGRSFEDNAVISGSSSLTKDHGFGAGISANPRKNIDWSFDYTRSAAYQMNTLSTTIGYRFGHGTANGKKK